MAPNNVPTVWTRTIVSSLDLIRKSGGPAFTASAPQEKMKKTSAILPPRSESYYVGEIETFVVAEVGELKRTKAKTALIITALCLACFLAALDVTIVTTALPTIAAEFKATEAEYTWVGSSYMLAAAATSPCWGKVSDTFGRKPILVLTNVIFLFGSLLCALSFRLPMLFAGRIFQGIGAGGLIALPIMCIGDMFSVRDRGVYLTITGLMWALAGSIGPVIGGALTEYTTWRWCFWINVPIDGITLIALLVFLDVHNPKTPLLAGLAAIDWLGIALIVTGTCVFLVGLNLGGVTYPWNSAIIICLILFGIATLVAFVIVERSFAKFPIMPTLMFRDRSNVAVLVITFIHSFVYIANTYFLPQYFQIVLGASPLSSGVYLLPYICTLCLIGSMTGYYIKLTGFYLPAIYMGMILVVLGQSLYIDLQPYSSWGRIVIFQILVGLGTGPIFQALTIAIHTGVEPRDTATATSTYYFARNMGTALSVVIGGTIFQNQIAARQTTLAAVLPASLLTQLGGGAVGGSLDLVKTLTVERQLVVKEVYTDSLRAVWIFYACIAALGLVSCVFLQKKVLSTTHTEHKTGLAGGETQSERDVGIGI